MPLNKKTKQTDLSLDYIDIFAQTYIIVYKAFWLQCEGAKWIPGKQGTLLIKYIRVFIRRGIIAGNKQHQ